MTTDQGSNIKALVLDKYSEIARANTTEDCCEPSCCSDEDKAELEEQVQETKTTSSNCGCDDSCCGPEAVSFIGDEYHSIDGYFEAADLKLGCGVPTEHAGISSGDVVLDLGSGAGNDAFVVRNIVGEAGRVIGLDFSSDMINLANINRRKLGFENIDFVHGEIEEIPLEDSSIDVVISNCVMNLVPDKKKAYAEAFRVLQDGGHFSISDIVYSGTMPSGMKELADLLTGCVSGALPRKEYLDSISEAGFTKIEVVTEKELSFPDGVISEYAPGIELGDFKIYSITVNGWKE